MEVSILLISYNFYSILIKILKKNTERVKFREIRRLSIFNILKDVNVA